MLPYLTETNKKTKKYIVRFKGLNMSEDHSDGEFSHTSNLSSALFPSITQRFGIEDVASGINGTTLFVNDGILFLEDLENYAVLKKLNTETGQPEIVYSDSTEEGTPIEESVDSQFTLGRKQTATIGRYTVIFPDKKYYDSVTNKTFNMEIEWNGSVTFEEGKIIRGENFNFSKGDAVTISGCLTNPENGSDSAPLTLIIREATSTELTFYANSFTDGSESNITIKRSVPNLDFVCESNNRLWGASNEDNMIWASKYGDPFNFNVNDGLSSDSYWIEVGTDGEFTGCIHYSSHICFFKENTLHKLYGSKPSNYQLVTNQVYGLQTGSERSLKIVNETLFYKGVNGVYSYSGGIPDLVSANFGQVRFSDACASSDGERYYINMRNGDEWGTYTYDIAKNIWLQEGNSPIVDMDYYNGNVYVLGEKLEKINPAIHSNDILWSATLCPFTETINEKKIYSKFQIRLELGQNSWVTVETRRDNETEWELVYTTHNERARTVTVPIAPVRCDSVEIRLKGKGECIIRNLVREFQVGSDV